MAVRKLPIVGVMGSGVAPYTEYAAPLGGLLARLEVHLLTGGGGGVMAEVARAFTAVAGRSGLSMGILPADRSGYPNPWVEIAVATHLPHSGKRGEEAMSRNHINVLSSNAIVALPGAAGTMSEVRLARRYEKPIIALGWSPPACKTAASFEEVEAFLRGALGGAQG